MLHLSFYSGNWNNSQRIVWPYSEGEGLGKREDLCYKGDLIFFCGITDVNLFELEICAVLLQTVLLIIRFYPNLRF